MKRRNFDFAALTTASTSDLTLHAQWARDQNDPVATGQILAAANSRRLKAFRSVASTLFPELKSPEPIKWLLDAEDICRRFTRTSSGNHHIYIALLEGYRKDAPYRPYVGESRYRPETRYQNHKAGRHCSRVVYRRGICLLPTLYDHLNPLPRVEAKQIERQLADALRQGAIPTEGGS